jgi:hypothetical protein
MSNQQQRRSAQIRDTTTSIFFAFFFLRHFWQIQIPASYNGGSNCFQGFTFLLQCRFPIASSDMERMSWDDVSGFKLSPGCLGVYLGNYLEKSNARYTLDSETPPSKRLIRGFFSDRKVSTVEHLFRNLRVLWSGPGEYRPMKTFYPR